MNTMLVSTLAAAAVVAGSGCISTHETVYRDTARMKVEFESGNAASLFYNKLNQRHDQQTSERKTQVHIPIIFEHTRTEKDSGNTAFNEAVRRCDTNQDGKITEAEAQIFSESKWK